MKARIEILDRNCVVTLIGVVIGKESLPGDVMTLAEALPKALIHLQDGSVDQVCLDFNDEESLSNELLRTITISALAMRKFGKKLVSKKISPRMKNSLNEQGLIDLFVFPSEGGSKTGGGISCNVEVANAFIDGAMETLKIQCSLPCQAGKATLRRNFKVSYGIDIMGIIGLTSGAFNGSVAICFSEQTFLAIMERMLGERYPKITDEVRDGAGELLNIIFGMAKVRLNKSDHRIEKAIPTVIHGKEIGLQHVTTEAIVLPFLCDAGPFHIEIGLEALVSHVSQSGKAA